MIDNNIIRLVRTFAPYAPEVGVDELSYEGNQADLSYLVGVVGAEREIIELVNVPLMKADATGRDGQGPWLSRPVASAVRR